MIYPADAKSQADAILFTIASICTQLNIPYFLISGTCLGLYRSGTYIPNDNDLDIAIIHTPDNFDRMVHDLEYWGFWTAAGEEWEGNHWWKWDILIDVTWMIQQGFYESHDILSYSGYDYHVPHPVEEYLAWKYGPTWRTPLPRGEYIYQHE